MKLNVDNVAYDIPERLTIEQWSGLMQWDFESEANWPRILYIATGAPLEYLQKAPRPALYLGIQIIVGIMNHRQECEMKPVSDLRFGEFIDLDIALSIGIDKTLSDMIDILGVDCEWADEALWICDKYTQWRNAVYRQYANLFGINDEQEDEEVEDVKKDPLAVQRAWYNIIVTLAHSDILRMDRVVEEPVIKTLNFMALQKQIQLEENAKILKQKREYELQANRR